jgi:hypothetical protein
VLFFVAVNQHWLGADRLWRWSIDSYVDWRTDRKVERIERRIDRLDDIVLSPPPAVSDRPAHLERKVGQAKELAS